MAPNTCKVVTGVAVSGLIAAAVYYLYCKKNCKSTSTEKTEDRAAASEATPKPAPTTEDVSKPAETAKEPSDASPGEPQQQQPKQPAAQPKQPAAQSNQQGKKKGKSKKAAKAAKAPKQTKEQKAAVKEGGKKGQDLSGMADMGGVTFFHLAMNDCNGDFALLELAMQAANKEVDPSGDDRKGGAGHIGKMLFSAGDDKLAVYCHVPAEQAEKVDIDEWVSLINDVIGGTIVEKSEDGRFVKFQALADPEKEKFPLKMRDNAISAGFAFLREKKLVMDDSSDDDSDVNLAEIAGIEW